MRHCSRRYLSTDLQKTCESCLSPTNPMLPALFTHRQKIQRLPHSSITFINLLCSVVDTEEKKLNSRYAIRQSFGVLFEYHQISLLSIPETYPHLFKHVIARGNFKFLHR
jgi:hypothetical protein